MAIRFPILFAVILLGLFAAEMTAPVQARVVQPFTDALAAVSGRVAALFDSGVTSSGALILDRASGFGVRIVAGCNGVEAMLVLAAAILAFRASWRARLIGLAAGFVAIQALNLVRVVSLFYLGRWNFAVFEFAHLYLWQALIMLDVVVVWLLWLRWVHGEAAASGDRAPG
jgi:exosortase H (IPTLxxWG-CTERM-specific)